MELIISKEALTWFKNEFPLENEQGIRFYGKIYGSTQVHDNFSLGISVDVPHHPLVETRREGFLFFIESEDQWFFEEYDLTVGFNKKLAEPDYHFHKK